MGTTKTFYKIYTILTNRTMSDMSASVYFMLSRGFRTIYSSSLLYDAHGVQYSCALFFLTTHLILSSLILSLLLYCTYCSIIAIIKESLTLLYTILLVIDIYDNEKYRRQQQINYMYERRNWISFCTHSTFVDENNQLHRSFAVCVGLN